MIGTITEFMYSVYIVIMYVYVQDDQERRNGLQSTYQKLMIKLCSGNVTGIHLYLVYIY